MDSSFRQSFRKALVEPVSDAVYFDGTFMGSSDLGEKGRYMVWVTVENDKIVDIALAGSTFTKDEPPKEILKGEEYPYEAFHQAVEEMPAKFVEANGTDVEAFTGATGSTEGWKIGIERALESAKR